MTPSPPRLDLPGRRLWASPRHLGRLARVATEGPAVLDDGPARDLVDVGVLSPDGEVIAALRPVARAAATARGVAHVVRLQGRCWRRAQVRVGPDGVLVAPSGDDDEVGEVALQRPDAMCRTLWRLLHLGPRPTPAHRPTLGPLPAARLLGAVRDGGDRLARLGVEPGTAVLDRVDVRTAPDATEPATMSVLDTPVGSWRAEGADEALTLRPVAAVEPLEVLAGWQAALVGPDADPARGDDAGPLRRVALDGGVVHVPVPDAWEELAPAPGLPLLARQRDGDGRGVTVTVAAEPAPGGLAPAALAGELAAGLPGGVAVDAWADPDGGTTAVVLHAGRDADVVTVQRRLPLRTGAAAVSYTCAVTRWPSCSAALRRWAAQASTG